jgi:hypothetical protein
MIKCLTALCAYFCFSQTVLAWNAEGHMVVTQIAYNHLDASVRARCDALIAVPLTPGVAAPQRGEGSSTGGEEFSNAAHDIPGLLFSEFRING